jgi:hypothetical protein
VPWEEVAPLASAVQPKAAPEVLAVWDAAVGPQPVAVWDVAVGPQPVAGSVAAGVRQPEEGAAPDAAERLPGVARVAVAERRRAARVAEVRRRAGPGEAARPSAAAWAAPLSTRLRADRPAPSPLARSAHARKSLRIAQP